jgi:polysaccharide export outer membrane protein
MRRWLYLVAAVTLVLFSVSLWAQGPASKSADSDGDKILAARAIDPQPTKTVTEDPNYSIGPDDVLTIDVWKEPEISRTLPVRTDGKISLPLLNDVQAAGLTPTQLSLEIAEKLQKDVVHPRVTVIVEQMNSRRIYILGQVLHGGAHPLLPNMTAVQALSGAGLTPFANLKKIYVMRIENNQKQVLPLNFKEVVNGHNPQNDLPLKSGDTIVVP